jgi:hypothetical protein
MLTEPALELIGDMLPAFDPEAEKAAEEAVGGFGGNSALTLVPQETQAQGALFQVRCLIHSTYLCVVFFPQLKCDVAEFRMNAMFSRIRIT